jgi:hypothetical protein
MREYAPHHPPRNDRVLVSAQTVLLRMLDEARLERHPDALAGLTWYYWLFVERVRSVNATAEEKQPLLSEIELWFSATRRNTILWLALEALMMRRATRHPTLPAHFWRAPLRGTQQLCRSESVPRLGWSTKR